VRSGLHGIRGNPRGGDELEVYGTDYSINVKKILFGTLVLSVLLLEVQSTLAQTYSQAELDSLQKTINVLEKSNSALSQTWTPLTSILTAIAVLFAAITILWGIIFAFGYIAYRSVRKYRIQLVKEVEDIRNNGQAAISLIEVEGRKMLEEVKSKKKTLAQGQKELAEFKKSAEEMIERLRSKTLVAVSDPRNTSWDLIGRGADTTLMVKFKDLSGDNLLNVKVCSQCGSLFKEQDRDSLFSLGSYATHFSSLCKKCREESST